MINLKTEQEIAIMKEGGRILAGVIQKVRQVIKPGVTTQEIDHLAERLISKAGAKPSFKKYKGYPCSSCLSVNEELVHSLPSKKIIKKGDLISVDIGVFYQGYHTDSAITFGVGKVSSQAEKLIRITKKSLDEGINLLKPGKKIGDIQAKIQAVIEKTGFSVIRDLSGHGIGKSLQEQPSIHNFGIKGTGFILKKGMTFCLEPMVAVGNPQIKIQPDGWTVITKDRSLSAHFEHTVAITKNGYLLLTKP